MLRGPQGPFRPLCSPSIAETPPKHQLFVRKILEKNAEFDQKVQKSEALEQHAQKVSQKTVQFQDDAVPSLFLPNIAYSTAHLSDKPNFLDLVSFWLISAQSSEKPSRMQETCGKELRSTPTICRHVGLVKTGLIV
jgi:hypothetical protein